MMQRLATLMRIKPGTEDEYRRRHLQVWQKMLNELKAAGCENYSIFRDGLTLFAYMEVADVARYAAHMAQSDVAARWEAYMSDILERVVDPATGMPPTLEEVFHLA